MSFKYNRACPAMHTSLSSVMKYDIMGLVKILQMTDRANIGPLS